jgi:phosphatidylserine/phosphatidylglycerophosphate/cardiolipin synthase-like enzyme
LVFEKSKNKVKVILVMDKKSLKENWDKIKDWKNNQIEIHVLKKETAHAKAILVDKQYLYIWSENFSTNSLDKNRETWILLKNKDIILQFIQLFEKDIIK